MAPTSVTHDPKTGKCKMNIKLPCEYREGRMIGVLDHEIGTHFLRKHNEKMVQIHNSKFKQQELPSWRPIATPLKTIVIFIFFSAFFFGFGIKIRTESLAIWE